MQKISLSQVSKVLLISTALLAPNFLSSALAADYIVSTPTTALNGGHGFLSADRFTITSSGSISTNGNYAVSGTNGNKVTNLGAINTQGGGIGVGVFGINLENNNIIDNKGSITTLGDVGRGIIVNDENQITNSGTISTLGDEGAAIFVDDKNKITNSGTISTQGADSYAIRVQYNNKITNSGTINTSGQDSYGVVMLDKDNEFINSGILKTTGSGANAIDILDEDNIVNNSGEIYALGANANAIHANSSSFGTIITNSGKVITIEGDSFKFRATDSQLNLLAPSFIGGRIDMGNANAVNITTGRSQSVLWDFSTHGASAPMMSFTGDVPYAWNATTEQFATIDPTALSAASNIQADMVNSLSDARQANADKDWWLSGFGNWSEYGANGIYNDYNIANGSVAVGANAQVNNSFSLGAMAGYGLSALSVNSKWETSQTINSKGFVGGIYGDANFDSAFVSAALYAGILGNDSNRLVNDNLEAMGIDHATANYNSWFVSPELTLGTNIDGDNGWMFTPSVSAKYGYQSIDGYSETGATNGNATFGARIAQTLEANAELAASQKIENGTITYRGGLDYRQNIGAGTASATIIGQNLDLPIDNSAQIIAYAGIDANYQLAGGAAINLSAKAGLGTNGYKSIAGSISLGGKF